MMMTTEMTRFALLLLVACVATLVPDAAWAVVPPNTPLANVTPAQLKALTGADVKNIPELNSTLKIARAAGIAIGSAIAFGGFWMFGMRSENPSTTGLIIAILIGLAIIVTSFFYIADIVAMVVKQLA